MIETLKAKTGRMAVIVPHGVLFRGSSEGKIRQKLIEENLLDAVIGLPEKLFYGTGIPAAILVFSKAKTDENVLFIDASRDFKSGKTKTCWVKSRLIISCSPTAIASIRTNIAIAPVYKKSATTITT